MRKFALLSACAAGAFGFALSASADSNYLTATFEGSGPADWMEINHQAGDAWDAPARVGGEGGYAGRMNFSGGVKAFCFEIDGLVEPGTEITFKHQDLDTFGPKSLYVRMHYSASYSGLTTGDEYAAFQMVLWEIMSEDWDANHISQLNIHLGAVQFNGLSTGAESAVAAQLASLSTGGYIGGLDVWTSEGYQDIITIVPGPSVALAGMIGLAGIRRRRRN